MHLETAGWLAAKKTVFSKTAWKSDFRSRDPGLMTPDGGLMLEMRALKAQNGGAMTRRAAPSL
jgi:hypothetical protein